MERLSRIFWGSLFFFVCTKYMAPMTRIDTINYFFILILLPCLTNISDPSARYTEVGF